MNNKRDILKLQLFVLCCKTRGKSNFGIKHKYFNDEEVIDCEIKLCDAMLIEDKEKTLEKFKEFQELYKKLSAEKKEYINEEIRNIFPEQNKNNKEKEKKL